MGWLVGEEVGGATEVDLVVLVVAVVVVVVAVV